MRPNPLDAKTEQELIAKAKGGDGAAFSALLKAHEPAARQALRLLVGQPDDVNDQMQEALLQAFTGQGDAHLQGFGPMLQGLAVRQALPFLAMQRPWRLAAQVMVENICVTHEMLSDLMEVMADSDFHFNDREHVAFCFTSVARSLSQEQQVAVVLHHALGWSQEQVADVLRAKVEDVARFAQEGRKTVSDRFEKICGLANPDAPCDHCKGLRAATAESRNGLDPEKLGLGQGTPEEGMKVRLRVVQSADLDKGKSHKMHDFLFRLMSDNEANRESDKALDNAPPVGKHRWDSLKEVNN